MVMRQAGEQAAQTAKDMKTTVIKTLDTKGAAPQKEAPTETATFIPRPPSVLIDAPTVMQSFVSSAWDQAPGATPEATTSVSAASVSAVSENAEKIVTRESEDMEMGESMQSPTTSAWKSVPPREEQPFDLPVTQHRGSEVSVASAEEIKNIEASEAIKEEDEEAIG